MESRVHIICIMLFYIAIIANNATAKDSIITSPKDNISFADAAALYINGDYHGTINALNDAIRHDSSFANEYNLLGMAYLKLHQWDNAEKALKHAINLDSNYAFAYYNLSEAIYSNPFSNDSQIVESVSYLRKSLETESDSMQTLRIIIRLGDYLYTLGQIEQARAQYQSALSIDSLCLPARFGIANTLGDSAALLEISRILEIDSSYIPALGLQATLSITDNKYLNAINIYCQILDLDSSRCQTYHNLLQLIDYYSSILCFWRDWYFVEGKRKTGNLFSPWFGYNKYNTMIKDQDAKFRRNSKEYQNNMALCSDSLFTTQSIKNKLSKLKLSINIRADSSSYFRMAEYLDVIRSTIIRLRETVELKAGRNTNCPLPKAKEHEYEIP